MKPMNFGVVATFLLLALAPIAHGAPAGRLIAVDSGRDLYEVNPTTGALNPIGAVTANVGTSGGLAYDPTTGTDYRSALARCIGRDGR